MDFPKCWFAFEVNLKQTQHTTTVTIFILLKIENGHTIVK